MSYPEHVFTTNYLTVDRGVPPLPPPEALAELDPALPTLARTAATAVRAARAAVQSWQESRFASTAVTALAAAIGAAAREHRPTDDLEAQLADLLRSEPARLAAAVTAC